MGSELINAFQSHGSKAELPDGALEPQSKENVVSSRDNELFYLFNRYVAGEGSAEQLKAEIDARELAAYRFRAVITSVVGTHDNAAFVEEVLSAPMPLNDFACHKAAHAGFEAACGKFSDYSLKFVRGLTNLCEMGFEAEQIVAAAQSIC